MFRIKDLRKLCALLVLLLTLVLVNGAQAAQSLDGLNPNPPSAPVRLIFVHHSTGENWLADDNGGLGIALRDNNYFVSDTNYGWGLPDADVGADTIGDHTDIGHYWNWFRGPRRDSYLAALYAESAQNSNYSRLAANPGGENKVILFKSCFPNSSISGSPEDPPAGDNNPLRGQDSSSPDHTVANVKGIYRDLLEYFATRPDKLFVLIVSPPLSDETTDPDTAANARAVANWLFNDWLAGYSQRNVAVFDFYNVLTTNGGNANTNDLNRETGNHHRWWKDTIQHKTDGGSNFLAYFSGDDHPSLAGNLKATGEFLPLLNIFYHYWQSGIINPDAIPTAPSASIATPTAPRVAPPPPSALPTLAALQSGTLIQPTDLAYVGAFRMPDSNDDLGWSWADHAITYYPDGDPRGPNDGYPGSLFGTGNNQKQWVSEISIPIPVNSPSKNVNELNTATTLQDFHDVRGDLYARVAGFDDFASTIPKAGLAYLPAQGEQSTGKLYFAWGYHLQEVPRVDDSALQGEPEVSHGWCELDLSNPHTAGAWAMGDWINFVTSHYVFAIDPVWAAANTPGKLVATGRFRDGGQGGRGPSLFAFGPWNEGNPPAPGTRLAAIPLLLYTNLLTEDDHTLRGYSHADAWTGGAWLTAGQKAAVIFAGTKAIGETWYGFEDGTVWPQEGPFPPPGPGERGWWAERFAGQILFYDPADLAAVARGDLQSYEPQPYAVLDVDPYLYRARSPREWNHVGDVTFDREHGLVFLLEPLVDDDKPIVHVWRVER